ncbi:MAG: recombinase-like helix-turn-helix domain-containing protein [Burkholderiales bacterium]
MGNIDYENKLGDALEKLMGEGADDLGALAAGLNKEGLAPPIEGVVPSEGVAWTPEMLAAEFKRLARSATT